MIHIIALLWREPAPQRVSPISTIILSPREKIKLYFVDKFLKITNAFFSSLLFSTLLFPETNIIFLDESPHTTTICFERSVSPIILILQILGIEDFKIIDPQPLWGHLLTFHTFLQKVRLQFYLYLMKGWCCVTFVYLLFIGWFCLTHKTIQTFPIFIRINQFWNSVSQGLHLCQNTFLNTTIVLCRGCN